MADRPRLVVIDGDLTDTSFDMTLDVPPEVRERADDLVRATGCERCGVASLSGPHLCEHGVTPAPHVSVEFTITVDAETYRGLVEGQ